jgi:hypothetical protein
MRGDQVFVWPVSQDCNQDFVEKFFSQVFINCVFNCNCVLIYFEYAGSVSKWSP